MDVFFYFVNLKGMVDPGEVITKTLVREFSEEALSYDLTFAEATNQIEAKNIFELQLKDFFNKSNLVIKLNWKH